MNRVTSTHLNVPVTGDARAICIGPDGSVVHVTRVMQMIQGRWKLHILFRLYAAPFMRMLQLKRDIPGISQKVLTQQLRQLADDGLVERIDFAEVPPRVEYRISKMGEQLLPVLVAMRNFSAGATVRRRATV